MEEDRQVAPEQHRSEWTVGDRRLAILALVIGLAIVIIAVCGYVFGWEWTGLVKPEQRTFWDWLKLLIVPTVLALGGYLFTRSENRRAQDLTDHRTREDRKIADQRRQDDTLQAYLDQVGQLFVNSASDEAGESDKVRTLVRARTLTALKMLDAEHNRSVLQFLLESGLLGIYDFRGMDLEGADLRGANLRRLDLSKANLMKAKLSEAHLEEATLSGANLRNANLNNAQLTSADLGELTDLREADLERAYMRDADLRSADLRGARLGHATLSGVDLEAAKLQKADLSHTDLRPTHLRVGESLQDTTQGRWERSISGLDIEYERSQHHFLQAELSFAELAEANLQYADLRYANLYKADLTDADLTGANLQGATARVRAVVPNLLDEEPADEEEREIRADLKRLRSGSPRPMRHPVPIKQLEQARSLRGAIMPNGQKYEDLLKDREGRKEDAENGGTS